MSKVWTVVLLESQEKDDDETKNNNFLKLQTCPVFSNTSFSATRYITWLTYLLFEVCSSWPKQYTNRFAHTTLLAHRAPKVCICLTLHIQTAMETCLDQVFTPLLGDRKPIKFQICLWTCSLSLQDIGFEHCKL